MPPPKDSPLGPTASSGGQPWERKVLPPTSTTRREAEGSLHWKGRLPPLLPQGAEGSPCGRYIVHAEGSPLPAGPGAGEEVVDLADLADLAELADDVAVAALHRAKSSESLVGVSAPDWAQCAVASAPSSPVLSVMCVASAPNSAHPTPVPFLHLCPASTCALPTPVPFLPTPGSSWAAISSRAATASPPPHSRDSSKVATCSRAVMAQVTHSSSSRCSQASSPCTTHRHSPPRQPPGFRRRSSPPRAPPAPP